MNKAILPLGLLATGVYLFAKGWNTAQGVQRLEYSNPRIKITKLSLTGADLQLQLDLRNPSSADIYLQYFYGNVNYLQGNSITKIAGFTFNPTGASALVVKARSTTTVPFTIRISSISAVSFISKLIKAISSGQPVSTMLQVDGSMYAAGIDIPVKFNYDVKSNAISGIGAIKKQRVNKWIDVYYLQGNYGFGWEDLTSETSIKEIKQRKKEYVENERGVSFRWITRREINPEWKAKQ